MKIPLTYLLSTTISAIKKFGYTDQEAAVICDVLMYAQLRGNNQGVVKLIGSAKGLQKDDTQKPVTIVKDTPVSQLLDGGMQFGMLVMKQAVDTAIEKAQKVGIGIVGIKNTASSTGAIGYYAREIANKNLIGFIFAGSPPTVNPHGSFEAKFGTNPLAFGVPTTKEPMVFDMATAAMAFFGLVEAATAGRQIPGDVAFDAEGNLTTDPNKAMDGAIQPFDRNYKGYGLSLLVEILTGPLVQASYVGIKAEQGWGNMILVIDPNILTDTDTFKKEMTELLENVKTAKTLPGKEVLIPGERGDAIWKQIQESGEVEIEEKLWEKLQQVAE
jgi:LDH2 family malate/lactate/ureidoglycolate dehydrogenase